jgi:hypothetical protein
MMTDDVLPAWEELSIQKDRQKGTIYAYTYQNGLRELKYISLYMHWGRK